MPNKNFSATITIGGAIASSFRAAVGGIQGGIKDIGKAVKDLKATSAKADAFNPAEVLKAGRAYQEAKRHANALAAEVRFLGENATKKQRQEAERARVASLRLQKAYETKRQSAHALRDELRKLGVNTHNLADEKKRLADRADLLSRRLGALQRIASADVGGAFRNLRNTVATAGLAIVGTVGAIGGAIFGIAKSTSDSGDKIAKTAQYLGITTDALQEFRYAGELAGVATEEMDAALEKLTIRVGDTVDPASDLGRAIRRVGLSVQELRAIGTEEAMSRIADGIASIEDPTIRAQTVVQLFGKSAINMVNVLKDGSAELAKMRKEAHDTGNVLGKDALDNSEKFNDAFYRARQSVLGAKNAIGSALLPVVIELTDEFREFVVGNGPAIREWAKGFADELRKSVPDIIAVGRAFAASGAAIVKSIDAVTGVFNALKFAAVAVGAVFAGKAIVALWGFSAAVAKVGAAVGALVATFNPVTIAVGAAVAALVGGALLVWKYWEPIGDFFGWIGDKVGSVVGKVANFFGAGSGSAPTSGTPISNYGVGGFGYGALFDMQRNAAAIDAAALRGSAGGNKTIVQQSIPITVQTQPGQSNEDIAESVARKLRERQASMARGALHDH